MTLWRRPSAFLPIALSLAALVIVILRIAVVGTAPEPDEGSAAHIWQLLMAPQPPAIFYFALRWLPQAPREALPVLALQIAAMLAALAPVFLLKL
jgi:hypothetical protein